MKKVFNYFKSFSVAFLALLGMVLLVGCPATPTPSEPTELDTPTGLKVVVTNDEYVVSFNEVENAGRYALTITRNGELYKELDIKNNAKLNLADAGFYDIKIKAKPKTSKFLQSAYSETVSFVKATSVINFNFEFVDENKDCYKITSYKETLPSYVIVPTTFNDLPITEIAHDAFNKSLVNEMVILDGITKIGNDAFKDSSYLKKITLPDTVSSLGDRVFSDCYALEEITIPGGALDTIPTEAFKNCASLEEITIPSNIHTIMPSAFSGCSGTTKYVSGTRILELLEEDGVTMTIEELTTYSSVLDLNNMLKDKNITSIKAFTNITGDESLGALRTFDIVLSDGLKEIKLVDENTLTSLGNGAFDDTTWYKNQEDGLVYFGKILYIYKGQHVGAIDNIREDIIGITVEAFFFQRNLTSITIPGTVKEIPHGCFRGCGQLQEITLNEGLERIDIMAFDGCYNLKSIIIPSTVKEIQEQAFISCSRLEEVTIKSDSKLTLIGASAFKGASALKEIYIPKNVSIIGDEAFSGCNKLTIKIAFSSIPDTWDKSWNPNNCPVLFVE